MRLKKRFVALAALVGAIAALSAVAGAGSPHFVGSSTFSNLGNTATVKREGGWSGRRSRSTSRFSGEAQCIKQRRQAPKGGEQDGFSSTETVPCITARPLTRSMRRRRSSRIAAHR
jgi:hypothetical protein